MITWKEVKYFLGLSNLSPELIGLWKEREGLTRAKNYFENTVVPSLIAEGYCIIPDLYLSDDITNKIVDISEGVGLKSRFSNKNGSLLISLKEPPEDAIQEW